MNMVSGRKHCGCPLRAGAETHEQLEAAVLLESIASEMTVAIFLHLINGNLSCPLGRCTAWGPISYLELELPAASLMLASWSELQFSFM